ncbi:MAG: hypothetical protein K2L54_01930 [Clostridiales bacterium]|nr:hypothetical protein [Clostridiales bacterium]
MATSKESMEKLIAVKNKFNYRQFIMIAVLLFATAADILMDYVHAGFDPAIFSDPSYWVKLGLTCLSVVLVTLATRDFFQERELKENQEVVETRRQIATAHAEIIKRDLATRFEEYVEEINAERKRKAYRAFLQLKVSKAKKDRDRDRWLKLLDTADADIEFLPTRGNTIKLSRLHHIKFYRVRMATIFSQVEQNSGDDENIETNEQAHISNLIFRKLFTLIAFSLTLSTLFFDQGTFAVAILINTFSKLFRTAMSIALGASDGQSFVRGTLLSKMKLRLDFIQKFIEKEKKERGTAFASDATVAAE